MSTEITLFKDFVAQMTDHMSCHNGNYAEIESVLNQLLAMVTGQVSGSWQVPDGLKQIFDRNGIVGVGSFNLHHRNPWVYIGPGAYWTQQATPSFLRPVLHRSPCLGSQPGSIMWVWIMRHAGSLSAPNNRPIWQFYWDGGSLSGVALYSGCAILFSGVIMRIC